MILTGKSERYAREVLKKIKTKHKKESHQLVSCSELCEFLGLNYEEVIKAIK